MIDTFMRLAGWASWVTAMAAFWYGFDWHFAAFSAVMAYLCLIEGKRR